MTKNIFKKFPLSEVKKRKYKTKVYVQAKTQVINHKKVLFLLTTENGYTTKYAITKEEIWTAEQNGTITCRTPYYVKASYYDYKTCRHIDIKAVFLSDADQKAFFGFMKHEEGDFFDVFREYINRIDKFKRRKSAEMRSRKEIERKAELWKGMGRLPKIDPKKYLPHYFVVNKDNETGFCTKCNGSILPKDIRHRKMVTCPTCGKEVQILRRSIKKNPVWDYDWVVYPDLQTMTLRYTYVERCVDQKDGKSYIRWERSKELARATMPENLEGENDIAFYEYQYKYGKYDFWKGGRSYFDNYGTFYTANSMFNGYAIPYKDMAPFFQKMYSYIPKGVFTEKGYWWIVVAYDMLKGYGPIYEKALKAGYKNVVMSLGSRFGWHLPDTLDELLGVDRNTKKLLGYNPSMKELDFAKDCKKEGILFKSPQADAIWNVFGEMPRTTKNYFLKTNTIAKCNYITKQIKNFKHFPRARYSYGYLSREEEFLCQWIHYLECCKYVGYDVKSKSVLYPKDFYKVDEIVANEYAKKQEEERKRKEAKERRRQRLIEKRMTSDFEETVRKLKQAMQESDIIKKMMSDSQGLIIKVPETPQELIQEHVALRNCLNTYVDKMATGKSIIFFIRKADQPDTPYYAMEYTNGMITQIRGKSNCEATPEVARFGKKVFQFIRSSQIIQHLACAVA